MWELEYEYDLFFKLFFFFNYLQYLVERKATKCADYFEDISAFNTLKAFVPFC